MSAIDRAHLIEAVVSWVIANGVAGNTVKRERQAREALEEGQGGLHTWSPWLVLHDDRHEWADTAEALEEVHVTAPGVHMPIPVADIIADYVERQTTT